ncbi:MAG: class IV adenylate cyclase [Planctomycetaceae bacterium]|jgi:adenylate cyclase class 2
MLEVELKFRCEDTGRLEADLSRLGARRADQVRQVDQYFNHPQRDFAQTDEAVRIRDTNGQTSLTYKGPLVDRESKTRREIELDLAGDQAREKLGEWLLAVGFRPVLQVEKTRQAWTLSRGGRDVEVAIDFVTGLGQFVELEIVAAEADLSPARKLLQDLAAELELTQSERRGYLTMLLGR